MKRSNSIKRHNKKSFKNSYINKQYSFFDNKVQEFTESELQYSTNFHFTKGMPFTIKL